MRYLYSILMIVLTAGVSFVLYFRFRVHPVFAYVVAINFFTLIFYGWDKILSQTPFYRIPEKTLHVMALIGGSIGAYLGQKLFRHKSMKVEFRKKFWWIVSIQALVVLIFWGLLIYWA